MLNISCSYIYFYLSVKSDFKVYLPNLLQTSYSRTSCFNIYPISASVFLGDRIVYSWIYGPLFIKHCSNILSKLFSIICWALFSWKKSELFLISNNLASISSKLKFSSIIRFCYLMFSFIYLCLFNNISEYTWLLIC